MYRGTGSDLREQTDADLEREVGNLARTLSGGEPLNTSGYTARAEELVRSQPFAATSRLIAVSIEGGGVATNQPELLGPALALIGPEGGSPSYPVPIPADGTEEEHDEESGEDEEVERSGAFGHREESDDLESARRLLAAGEGFTTVEIEDVGDLRLLVRQVALPDGGGATIRVGQALASVERALDGLSRNFLIVGILTLVVATVAGWFLASRTAAPVRRIAGVAEGVDGGDLTARMPISETRNDEVRRLAESFNRMLDRLEEAFTGQRAFVADASHDLRTPLTIVKGQLEVLARNPDPGPEEIRRVTLQVTAATARMERLVDDLLLLARADSGIEPSSEHEELAPLLVAEVEGFRETSERVFEIGEVSDRPVEIDRDRMARAISNLISNAVAHTARGGRLRVSAVDRGRMVVIAVEDDGPGVPAGMRDRVFDRFARLDSSRSSAAGGSGLGLAIVKAIVESQGGTVGCSDSELAGARFTILLPAA